MLASPQIICSVFSCPARWTGRRPESVLILRRGGWLVLCSFCGPQKEGKKEREWHCRPCCLHLLSHHCCPFLPRSPSLSSELWFSHHFSIHPHWLLLNNTFCPITASRLFISYNSLMTGRRSWTHFPLLCPALGLGCFDHSFLGSFFLTLSLPSAQPFLPTVPPSISQPSEDSLFILRPLAVSSFKISPSLAFSQLIDFLFNGFSGPISFSPLTPPPLTISAVLPVPWLYFFPASLWWADHYLDHIPTHTCTHLTSK